MASKKNKEEVLNRLYGRALSYGWTEAQAETICEYCEKYCDEDIIDKVVKYDLIGQLKKLDLPFDDIYNVITNILHEGVTDIDLAVKNYCNAYKAGAEDSLELSINASRVGIGFMPTQFRAPSSTMLVRGSQELETCLGLSA